MEDLHYSELIIYLGTLEEPRNLSEVARAVGGEKAASLRPTLSRNNSIESMLDSELIEPYRDSVWKYKADESKLEEVLKTAGIPGKTR